MTGASKPPVVAIRPAVSEDAAGIARAFMESAEHHAQLDPERYWIPASDAIEARYREGQQHPPGTEGNAITLVAEREGEIVGFLDARLQWSADAMHRDITFCHIADIAVNQAYRAQGIGEQLMRAAEDWGKQQGAEFTSLEYLAANTRAVDLYQRLGYRSAAVVAIKRL